MIFFYFYFASAIDNFSKAGCYVVMIMRDKLVYRGGVGRTFVATRMSNASFVILEFSCFFLFCLFICDSLRKRAFRVSNVCLFRSD